MDNDKLEELKKETVIDNSRLEELIKQDITAEMQMEVFEELKKSQLFLPVTFSAGMFEGIEDAKEGDVFKTTGEEGFDINFITDSDGNRVVPLFTSGEAMKEAGFASSAMVMHASDIADMLEQSDRYSEVAINPFTENDISMPVGLFIALFEELTEEEVEFFESLDQLLEVLKEDSVELDITIPLILCDDENFMVDNAVDGVFVSVMPLFASTNPEYGQDLKYTNILMMPESSWILPVGSERDINIIIAPGSKFKIEEEVDEFTTVWMCTAQPFYDD